MKKTIQFSKPMVHPSLKTWSSNLFITIDNYIISFSGDDGNSMLNRQESIRHYLRITKDGIDVTGKLGFVSTGTTFEDFMRAISVVEKQIIPNLKVNEAISWWSNLSFSQQLSKTGQFLNECSHPKCMFYDKAIKNYDEMQITEIYNWFNKESKQVDFKCLSSLITNFASVPDFYPIDISTKEIENFKLFFKKLSESSSFVHKAHKELKNLKL